MRVLFALTVLAGFASAQTTGSGTFTQAIAKFATVTVFTLPAGIEDIYIQLNSAEDIDLDIYDGTTGIVNGQYASFQKISYANLSIEYSGYNGEQRSDAMGQEYIYIAGALPRELSLRVYGYAAGTATVTYSWGYYHNATGTDATLKTNLHNIIDGHTKMSYRAVWAALKRTDQDADNTDNVVCFYSRRSEPKTNQDDGSNDADAWNREHIYAKSHGHFGTAIGAGTDIHALRASDKSVNNERGSKDFEIGGAQLSSTEPRADCPLCLETNTSFEPPNAVKGQVARMIFYMAVRYNGDLDSNSVALSVVEGIGTLYGSSTKNNGQIGDLSTLKLWNTQYPPSTEEYRRNNLIHGIQGNRNPFIDHPEWVDFIF